ncbi:MAG TPA: GNAT family N-acetyltransferase [Candidatus Elarobacter sp.]
MIRIREARPGDEAFITALVPRFVEHGAADGHTPETVIEGTARVLREALREPDPDDLFLVAEDDDATPAGFVYAVTERDFFTDERYAHISELAVARSGTGVGAALMAAAEAWARNRGYAIVSLNVVDRNAAARRLYERSGYTHGHHHFVKRL